MPMFRGDHAELLKVVKDRADRLRCLSFSELASRPRFQDVYLTVGSEAAMIRTDIEPRRDGSLRVGVIGATDAPSLLDAHLALAGFDIYPDGRIE
jgi:hypothetical protein